MKILHRNKLPLGGFAGLKEHRLVTDSRVWGNYAEKGAWNGIGGFVYLADARFLPKGETGMHPHHEIDVISFMLKGKIAHEGSLEHGELLQNFDVQVQRAGGEGFSHNEVNPDNQWNRMIQLWVMPETSGERSGYKKYQPERGAVTQIYGGEANQSDTFTSKTAIFVALLEEGQELLLQKGSMAYLCLGSGEVEDTQLGEGALVSDAGSVFKATEFSHLIVIQTTS